MAQHYYIPFYNELTKHASLASSIGVYQWEFIKVKALIEGRR